jgi:hypothetical protein
MPSPFPGIDPYLEAQGRWPGFHNVLIAYCSEVLNRELPESYVAQTDERITVPAPLRVKGDIGGGREGRGPGALRG